MLVGLGHVDLVCRELERSLRFYDAVFGPIGLQPPVVVEGERGEQIHYLRFPAVGSGSLGLRQALEEQDYLLYEPACTTSLSRSSRARTWTVHITA